MLCYRDITKLLCVETSWALSSDVFSAATATTNLSVSTLSLQKTSVTKQQRWRVVPQSADCKHLRKIRLTEAEMNRLRGRIHFRRGVFCLVLYEVWHLIFHESRLTHSFKQHNNQLSIALSSSGFVADGNVGYCHIWVNFASELSVFFCLFFLKSFFPDRHLANPVEHFLLLYVFNLLYNLDIPCKQ